MTEKLIAAHIHPGRTSNRVFSIGMFPLLIAFYFGIVFDLETTLYGLVYMLMLGVLTTYVFNRQMAKKRVLYQQEDAAMTVFRCNKFE